MKPNNRNEPASAVFLALALRFTECVRLMACVCVVSSMMRTSNLSSPDGSISYMDMVTSSAPAENRSNMLKAR